MRYVRFKGAEEFHGLVYTQGDIVQRKMKDGSDRCDVNGTSQGGMLT
jgi:hypothetical protein